MNRNKDQAGYCIGRGCSDNMVDDPLRMVERLDGWKTQMRGFLFLGGPFGWIVVGMNLQRREREGPGEEKKSEMRVRIMVCEASFSGLFGRARRRGDKWKDSVGEDERIRIGRVTVDER